MEKTFNIIINQRGQATVEALVSTLALVPLLILTPYLGKYLDVKSKTIESVRYSTWERSIYSDPRASWGSDEHSKDDQSIANEARSRILGAHRAPILSTASNPTNNPLWRDHVGDDLVSFDRLGGTGYSLNENGVDSTRGATVALTISDFSIGPIDFGLGLNTESKADARLSLDLKPLPNFARRGAAIDIEQRSITDPDTPLTPLSQAGQFFSDSWVPGSEDNFADRIDGLVVDEVLTFGVAPGTQTFGRFFFFREAKGGRDSDLTSESDVIPRSYVDDLGDVGRGILGTILPPPFPLLL